MACTFHIQLHDKILWVSYCQKIGSILRSSLILTSNEDNFASPMGTFDCRFEMGKTCGQMRFRRANTLALDCKIGDAIFGLQYKGKSITPSQMLMHWIGQLTLAASRETIANEMLRKSYKANKGARTGQLHKSFLQVMSSQHMLGSFKLQHPFLVPSITGYRSRANMHHECDLLQRAFCVWMLLLQTTQIWGR